MAKTPNQTGDDLAARLKEAEEARAKAEAELAQARADLEIRAATIAEKDRLLAASPPARAPADPRAAGKPGPAVRIAARPKNGFRRAGVHHPPEPVDHPAGRFTIAQVDAMRADPNLSVMDI